MIFHPGSSQTRHLKTHHCRRSEKNADPIQSIEEGAQVLDEILRKELLCRHDIDHLNQAYGEIDLLERKVNLVSAIDRKSSDPLQKIIDKVQKIAAANKITPIDLISLYHLRNFSNEDLRIDDSFAKALINFDKTPENLEEIATQFPICCSESEFEEGISVLIGSALSEKIAQIVNHKKGQLQSYAHLQKEISARQEALAELRKTDPEKYPAYLDELLDNGYLYLYDHLIQMRALSAPEERRAKIETMTFSEVSHVVLETREAVIQKVKSSFPESSHEIVFLLGPTKTGKSTALCYLRGDTMKLKPPPYNCYESSSDKEQLIGQSAAASCTFLPSVEVIENFVIVDFPGFEDTNGQLISLGMECALRTLIKEYHPKILLMHAITEKDRGFKAAADLGARLKRLLANKEHCYLGITKYTQDANYRETQRMECQSKRLKIRQITDEEIELQTQIETLSELNDPALQPDIDELYTTTRFAKKK